MAVLTLNRGAAEGNEPGDDTGKPENEPSPTLEVETELKADPTVEDSSPPITPDGSTNLSSPSSIDSESESENS